MEKGDVKIAFIIEVTEYCIAVKPGKIIIGKLGKLHLLKQ